MAVDTTALCSLAFVKSLLNKSDTTDDAFTEGLINKVSVFVETFCRRTFSLTTHTELHNGDSSAELLVDNWPISSITSIHNSSSIPAAFDSGSLESATYYTEDPRTAGRIKFLSSVLYIGIANVQIVYAAGYDRGMVVGAADDTLPQDLQMAVAQHVTKMYKDYKMQKKGVSAMAPAGAGSATFINFAGSEPIIFDPDVKAILLSYQSAAF